MTRKQEEAKEIPFLKVKKINAQKFIDLVSQTFKDISVRDPHYKVKHAGDHILFPLKDDPELIRKMKSVIKEKIVHEIVSEVPQINPDQRYHSISDVLMGKFPEKFLKRVPNSYDLIGEIAIIDFDDWIDELRSNFKVAVAEAIMTIHKNIHSVFEKRSEVNGTFRLRKLKLLCGTRNTTTIHRENGCEFKVDVKKTFFTPRLVYERRRISHNDFEENELIVDLFSGVGPFSIQIAKRHDVKIHAFDINPIAIECLKENIRLNDLRGEIHPHLLNVKSLLDSNIALGNSMKNGADRIIMNLPESSKDFIDVACHLMKRSGVLHFYAFCERPNPIQKGIGELNKGLAKIGYELKEIKNAKIVKPYSPKADMVIIDARIESINS